MDVDRGVLVAVEGVDASGLTTHSKLLVERLRSAGLRAVYTKEPTEGPVGRVIRSFLRAGHEDHRMLALLFAADRIWHFYSDPLLPGGGIRGALDRGFIVVSDRYKYSSLAYQGSFVGVEWVDSLNVHVPEADILVFIDLDVEINLRRLRMRSERELYEAEKKIRRIRETFERVLQLAVDRGVHVIRVRGSVDGLERSVDEVSSEIFRRVSRAVCGITGCGTR